MAGVRHEYCAKWQQTASAQESNKQMAIWGSRRPTEKIAARQLTGHAGQKKNCSAAINRLRWPKEKIAVQQSAYRAGQKKNCSAAINGLRRPKEKNCGAAIGVSCLPLQKLRRGNQGFAPSSKIVARQSGYRACLFKNHARLEYPT